MSGRARLFLVIALTAVAAGAASIVPSSPATAGPPTTRVLVFGDSVAHSFGCALGDEGPPPAFPCDPVPGFTTLNLFDGACSIARAKVLGYDGGLYKSPCNPAKNWQGEIDAFAPDLIILNTGGWEIVDRWVSKPTGSPHKWNPGPDTKWAKAGNTTGADLYRAKLIETMEILTADNDVKVILSNLPYVNPKSAASGVYFEPYPDTQPGNWTKPNKGSTYRPSRVKADELNAVIADVAGLYDPAQVFAFPFAGYFNPGGAWGKYICKPAAQLVPDLPALPCSKNDPDAILARNSDHLHLTVGAVTNLLQPALLDFIGDIPDLPTSTTTTTTTTTTTPE